MSASAKLRIISYAVSSDRSRRRVARILEDVGTRVQYSLFEARLTAKALDDIVQKTLTAIDDTDSLRIYTIGKSGERHCKALGACPPIDKEAGFWLM